MPEYGPRIPETADYLWIERQAEFVRRYGVNFAKVELITREEAMRRYLTEAEFHAQVYLIGTLLAGQALPDRLRPYVLSVTA